METRTISCIAVEKEVLVSLGYAFGVLNLLYFLIIHLVEIVNAVHVMPLTSWFVYLEPRSLSIGL